MPAEGCTVHQDLSMVIGTPQELGTGSDCTLAESARLCPLRLLSVLISTLGRGSGAGAGAGAGGGNPGLSRLSSSSSLLTNSPVSPTIDGGIASVTTNVLGKSHSMKNVLFLCIKRKRELWVSYTCNLGASKW